MPRPRNQGRQTKPPESFRKLAYHGDMVAGSNTIRLSAGRSDPLESSVKTARYISNKAGDFCRLVSRYGDG